jgi:hypothetical protein
MLDAFDEVRDHPRCYVLSLTRLQVADAWNAVCHGSNRNNVISLMQLQATEEWTDADEGLSH